MSINLASQSNSSLVESKAPSEGVQEVQVPSGSFDVLHWTPAMLVTELEASTTPVITLAVSPFWMDVFFHGRSSYSSTG